MMAKSMKKTEVKSSAKDVLKSDTKSAAKSALKSDAEPADIKSAKMVYFFDEGKKEMKELLGGKGANLAEMTTLGIPVPSGFTITTETCHMYHESGKEFPKGLKEQIDANLARLEKEMDARFNDGYYIEFRH